MKSTTVVTWMLSAALPAFGADAARAQAPAPTAKKVPHMQKLHGDELVDPYYWMRERENPEVRAYLEKENAYADAFMKPTEAFQKALYDEMLARIKETDLTVPYRDRGYYYYSRTEKGKQYSIYCRKKGTLEAPEQIILDVNELAKGQRFMSVGVRNVTDDGRLLAYTTDNTGFRDYTLQIKDLATGKLLPEKMERVTSVAWAPDNKTLFYATTDHAKRPFKIWRHTLGTDPSADALLYEEKDERFRVGAYRSRSGAYLFFPVEQPHDLGVAVPAGGDAGGRDAARRAARARAGVLGRSPRRSLLHHDQRQGAQQPARHGAGRGPRPGELDGGRAAPRRRDARRLRPLPGLDRPLRAPGRAAPHPASSDAALAGGYRIEFPEAIYSAGPQNNREFDTGTLRIEYESFTTPPSVYDYDMATKERKLLKQREVLGGYDASRYTSERRYATASDGTKVPISLVYKKGFVADGKAPAAAHGLRLLRRLERRRLRLDARQPARPRRRLRRGAHPRAAATSARSGTTKARCSRRRTPSPTSSPSPRRSSPTSTRRRTASSSKAGRPAGCSWAPS